MMLTSLITILKSYKLNGLIQLWILSQLQSLAAALKQPLITQAITDALPAVEEANRLRRAWERLQKKHQGSDLARTLDQQIDRQVSATHKRLQGLAELGGDLGAAATTMLEQAFPRGLAHHVNAPHLEQAGHNLNLLTVLRDPEHKDVSDYLHLGDLRKELEVLVSRFNAAIGLSDPITSERVHLAEKIGENAVMKVVCIIIANYDENKPDELRLRDALLEPFLGANRHLGEKYADRAKKKTEEKCDDDANGEKKDEANDEKMDEASGQPGEAETKSTTTKVNSKATTTSSATKSSPTSAPTSSPTPTSSATTSSPTPTSSATPPSTPTSSTSSPPATSATTATTSSPQTSSPPTAPTTTDTTDTLEADPHAMPNEPDGFDPETIEPPEGSVDLRRLTQGAR
jgi:hypothetical protein